MADTRHFDLEELYKNRQNARNAFERDLYDRTMDTIMRESGAVRSRREDLVKAVRGNDHRAIKRIQAELNKIKADKTYGRDY